MVKTCALLEVMLFSVIRYFKGNPIAPESEIADMGKITKGAVPVGYLYPPGNEEVNLMFDGKGELGVFHAMLPK